MTHDQSQAKAQRWSEPHIFVQPEKATIKLSPAKELHLLATSVAHSKLLSNIFNSCSNVPSWDAALEIDAEALQQWLSHVQPGGMSNLCKRAHATPVLPSKIGLSSRALEQQASSTQTSICLASRQQPGRHAKRKADEESQRPSKVPKSTSSPRQEAWALCLLLQASDVLMDEVTEAEACRALAAALEQEADLVLQKSTARKAVIAAKVFAALSEDLSLKVLAAIDRPFPALLRYLSTTPFRPLLLRALNPSVDTHATLSLTATPITAVAMPAMLKPLATFTHLQSLSFAGHPLLHLQGWIGYTHIQLGHALREMPRLTHLCLRDTALRACADSLAAALPALPLLHTLDASGNRLDGAFAALAAALPAATALRTLLLDGTIGTTPALRALAAALWHMPQIEELSVGAVCTLDSSLAIEDRHECLRRLEPNRFPEQIPASEVLLELFAPLRSMHSLRSLELTFKLSRGTARNAAPAVASLTQLHHLRLCSADLCNMPATAPQSDVAGDHANAQHASRSTQDCGGCVMPTNPTIATPGSGLSRLCHLTSLDLAAATSRDDRQESDEQVMWEAGALMSSVEGLHQLQVLELPCACLSADDCTAIMRTAEQLACLTRLGVRATKDSNAPGLHVLAAGLARLQSLKHVRVPLILSYRAMRPAPEDEVELELEQMMPAPIHPESEALAVLRQAAAALAEAAAEKVVEIDLQCHERPMVQEDADEAYVTSAREVLGHVLPLCRSMHSCGICGVQTDVMCSSLDRMTGLTSLALRVECECSDDDWAAGRCEGHERLMRHLGCLTGLRSLVMESEVGGMLPMCTAFCDQLTCLSQLSSLEVAVRGVDHQFVPEVIGCCGKLPALRRLGLQLLEHLPHRDNGVLVWEPEWWADTGPPVGWAVGELTSLQTLLVLNHGNISADDAFWEGLKRLSRLQSLHMNDAIDKRHLHMLAYRLHHSGGLALQDMHLALSEWLNHASCDMHSDCAEFRQDCERFTGLTVPSPW